MTKHLFKQCFLYPANPFDPDHLTSKPEVLSVKAGKKENKWVRIHSSYQTWQQQACILVLVLLNAPWEEVHCHLKPECPFLFVLL